MIVTTIERTNAKLEAEALHLSWLRAVLDDVDAGFLVESLEHIAYVNRAYARLLGQEPDDLIGRHLTHVIATQDAARLIEYARQRSRFQPAPRDYDFAARHRDLSVVHLHASVSASWIRGRLVISTMARAYDRPALPRNSPDGSSGPHEALSRRETEVLEMILAGKRMKEIAFVMDVSPKTVSTHRNRLLRKLHLTSNRELFQYALRHELIDWS